MPGAKKKEATTRHRPAGATSTGDGEPLPGAEKKEATKRHRPAGANSTEEKFVYVFGRKLQFFSLNRRVKKIVYIQHEKKIQNFSSNRKVQNLFTFLAENVNFFSSNGKVKKLFTFGMRRKFKNSRQIGKCKICLHFGRQF